MHFILFCAIPVLCHYLKSIARTSLVFLLILLTELMLLILETEQ